MEPVWRKIAELREQYATLREDRTPIDVFTFLEIDLGLDPIPFDDLTAKYRVEAAIKADFTGIYLDAEQYKLMEKGPEWKLSRLRFTVAHELAHYFCIEMCRKRKTSLHCLTSRVGTRIMVVESTLSNRRQMNLRGGCSFPNPFCRHVSMSSLRTRKNFFLILLKAVRCETSLPKKSVHVLELTHK